MDNNPINLNDPRGDAPDPKKATTHKVTKGQTLAKLSKLTGVSIADLKAANKKIDWNSSKRTGKKQDWLYEGESIIIPPKDEAKGQVTTKSKDLKKEAQEAGAHHLEPMPNQQPPKMRVEKGPKSNPGTNPTNPTATILGIPAAAAITIVGVLLPSNWNEAPHSDFPPTPNWDKDPNKKGGDDDFITLYRGVPSIDPYTGKMNKQFPPATRGVAIARGGTSNPTLANNGDASVYTFWTTSSAIAYEFATDGQEVMGIVLMKRFPISVLSDNKSPDRFQEGEIQIIGPVTGAIPIPVNVK